MLISTNYLCCSECQSLGVRYCIPCSTISLASFITHINLRQIVRQLNPSRGYGGKIRAGKTWSLIYYPFNAWPSARGVGRAWIDGKLGLGFCASLPPSIIISLNFPLLQNFSHFREARSLRSKGLLDVSPRNVQIEVYRLTDTRFGLLQ